MVYPIYTPKEQLKLLFEKFKDPKNLMGIVVSFIAIYLTIYGYLNNQNTYCKCLMTFGVICMNVIIWFLAFKDYKLNIVSKIMLISCILNTVIVLIVLFYFRKDFTVFIDSIRIQAPKGHYTETPFWLMMGEIIIAEWGIFLGGTLFIIYQLGYLYGDKKTE
jgi:hypothetical protein